MDEIRALRGHRSDVAPPAEHVRTTARAALLRRVDATSRTSGGLRRPWWPAIAAVAGAIAVAAAFVISVNVNDGPLAPSPAAAEALRAVAAVAEARQFDPDFVLSGEGQYRYTKSEGAFLSTRGAADGISGAYSVIVPKLREIWIAADGSGHIRETAGEPVFLGERDRQRWEADGRPQLVHTITQDFGPVTDGGGLFYRDLSTLPTDHDELAAVLRARAEEMDNGKLLSVRMFGIIGNLLRETVAPPALRAALYRVAADLPGIELVGDVTDAAGRPGVAVAMTDDSGIAERRLMIFDRDSSVLLATETILLERTPELDADPPVRISYAVFLESKVVDGLP